MGCDIHGWVEVRPFAHDIEYWRSLVNITFWERNYLFFARVFGVRNHFEVKPISPDRGLPPTSSWSAEEPEPRDIQYKEEKADAHSESWISFTTFRDNKEVIFKPQKPYTFEKWKSLYQIMEILAKQYGEDRVRLVVWFDN